MEYKLTPEIIEELKKSYPGITIFKKIPFPTKIEFALRPLYPQDHESLLGLARNMPVDQDLEKIYEEYIWNNCVLWPMLTDEDQQMLPIGVKPEIQHAVSYMSGYVSVTPQKEVIAEPKTVSTISAPNLWEPPSGQEITDLKEEYNYCFLFKVRIGPYHFIIKPILQGDLDYNFDMNDHIAVADKGTIWPEEFNMALIPMGTIISLAATIKNISGETQTLDIEEL